MSKAVMLHAPCPSCGKDVDINYYESVNANDDADFRARVLDGSFFHQTCPHCGAQIPIVAPMLYHDPKQAVMIYMIPVGFERSTEKLSQLLGILLKQEKDHASHYRTRTVTSPDKLIEKIHIFEDGLNDSAVELVKLTCLRQYAADLGKVRSMVYRSAEGDQPARVIFAREKGQAPASVDFSRPLYEHYLSMLQQEEENEDEHFMTVDERSALALITSKAKN
jgi:hypothetical protein